MRAREKKKKESENIYIIYIHIYNFPFLVWSREGVAKMRNQSRQNQTKKEKNQKKNIKAENEHWLQTSQMQDPISNEKEMALDNQFIFYLPLVFHGYGFRVKFSHVFH